MRVFLGVTVIPGLVIFMDFDTQLTDDGRLFPSLFVIYGVYWRGQYQNEIDCKIIVISARAPNLGY